METQEQQTFTNTFILKKNEKLQSFIQTKGTLGFASTFFDKLTFQITNEAGISLNEKDSDVSFIKPEFNLRYVFAKNHYASVIANYGRLDNNVFKNIDLFKDIKSGYAIGYSYDTFIGPIELN